MQMTPPRTTKLPANIATVSSEPPLLECEPDDPSASDEKTYTPTWYAFDPLPGMGEATKNRSSKRAIAVALGLNSETLRGEHDASIDGHENRIVSRATVLDPGETAIMLLLSSVVPTPCTQPFVDVQL